jgi:hypothetical protein
VRAEELVWGALLALTVYAAKEADFNQGFLPVFITNPFNVSILASFMELGTDVLWHA